MLSLYLEKVWFFINVTLHLNIKVKQLDERVGSDKLLMKNVLNTRFSMDLFMLVLSD